MNRITKLFKEKKNNILSVYYTAGYPNLGDTISIAAALEKSGADLLEIGFPYSDPVADGPVIQASSKQALDNGMDVQLLFEQLKELREKVTIPVLLMGYVNPVLQYGVEKFCKSCAAVGIDGCIIPDLPMAEYEEFYKDIFLENGLSNVFLVTPQTSVERLHKIDSLSTSFIYLLSVSSTTGKDLQVLTETTDYFSRVRDMKLNHPTMIGFGISSREAFEKACEYSNGGIIGTSFLKSIAEGPLQENIDNFMRKFKS